MFRSRLSIFNLLLAALSFAVSASAAEMRCWLFQPLSVIGIHGTKSESTKPESREFYVYPGSESAALPKVTSTTDKGGDWLSVSLSSASAGTTGTRLVVNVQVDGDSLPPGTYTGQIRVTQDGQTPASCIVPVTLQQDVDAITLEHMPSFSDGPMYLVRIESTGAVYFRNGPRSDLNDQHTTTITVAQYKELVEAFQRVHFFDLKDAYPVGEDIPVNLLGMTLNGKTKVIKGFDARPADLAELGFAVERAANVHGWRHPAGTRVTLKSLLSGPNSGWGEDLKYWLFVSDDVYHRTKLGATVLMQAAGLNNAASIEQEIHAGQNVNVADETGWTALMIAAAMAQPRSTAMLLDAGARVDQRDHHGDTALIGLAAVRFYNLRQTAEVATILLAHGATVDAANELGETALMWAARVGNPDLIQVLLKAGANPDQADRSGGNALYYLRNGRHELSYDPQLVARYDQAEKVLLQGRREPPG